MAIRSRTTLSLLIAAAGAAFLLASSATQAAGVPGEKVYQRNCQGCHGANLEGSAAYPNLTTSPKAKDKAAFVNTVMNGQNTMPAQKDNKMVAENIDALYEFVNSKAK